MTLFLLAAPDEAVFQQVLDKYFDGVLTAAPMSPSPVTSSEEGRMRADRRSR